MSGAEVAKAMIELGLIPERLVCHSANPSGRAAIVDTFARAGVDCAVVSPGRYRPPARRRAR